MQQNQETLAEERLNCHYVSVKAEEAELSHLLLQDKVVNAA